MSKKVRKPRSSSPRTYAEGAAANPASSYVPPTASAVASTAVSAAQSPRKEVDLEADYQYVGKDLKRLAVTATLMFLVLIGLNVVLNILR